MFAYLIDIGFNPAHALANPAAIGFQFLLTRTADADTPRTAACGTSTALAAQPRHRDAFPGQARQQIIQLCQLHLQLAFATSCVARKNVKNELGAVDDPAFRSRFDVSLLHRRKIAVKNDQRRFVRRGLGANFVQFAAPDERSRVRSLA